MGGLDCPPISPRFASRSTPVAVSLPDPSFVFAQSVSGLTAAMFLFLIAAGLSLIFGVLRVLNFAHGTFYMLGAYATYQLVQWMGVSGGRFWLTALGGALVVAALGGLIERFLFRRLYGKDELYQLLFTYALALILSDAAKMLWGTQQKSVSRPPELTGALHVFGAIIPHYNLFIILLGPAIALAFWGTFLGALIYGQVLSFGILFFPRFSIFAVFALMAAVLIVRPWGLLGRPLR